MSTIFMLWSMPWPLHRHVPVIALAMSVTSLGGFESSCAAALVSAAFASALGSVFAAALVSAGLGAAGAAFGSAAFGSFGCAATRPVIPTIAMATRENVFMSMLLLKPAHYTQGRVRHIPCERVPLRRRPCRDDRHDVRDLVETCRSLAGLIDVTCRSRFIGVAMLWILSCSGPQRENATTPVASG